MGGGIGQWLLLRAGDGSLSLFSLVVPSGAQTPVHDHLAWGLVGPLSRHPGRGGLRAQRLARAPPRDAALARPGDFYALDPAGRGHPPRPDDVRGGVRLDPPADERHRLRLAACLRPGNGERSGPSGRDTSTPRASGRRTSDGAPTRADDLAGGRRAARRRGRRRPAPDRNDRAARTPPAARHRLRHRARASAHAPPRQPSETALSLLVAPTLNVTLSWYHMQFAGQHPAVDDDVPPGLPGGLRLARPPRPRAPDRRERPRREHRRADRRGEPLPRDDRTPGVPRPVVGPRRRRPRARSRGR